LVNLIASPERRGTGLSGTAKKLVGGGKKNPSGANGPPQNPTPLDVVQSKCGGAKTL